MYFFPTNALYSLKSFILAMSNSNFYFFLLLLGFEEEDPKGASCQDDQQPFFLTCSTKMLVFFLVAAFIPEIPEQTSGLEWHKTSRSRVHRAKIHLIILHLTTFLMSFSKKCLRWTLNWERQGVPAEGKISCMKFELFQNSCCHFSQF